MESKPGGRAVEESLDDLENAIDAYYGMLNLIRMGIKPRLDEIHEKPETMTLVEACENLNMQRVSGGLEDQPYIWLLEQSVTKQRIELQEQLFKSSNQGQQNAGAA